MSGVSIGSSNRGYLPLTTDERLESNMARTGRILSRDAEKWFGDNDAVSIGAPGLIIKHRATSTIVTRGKYLAVLKYAKNQHVQHCRRELAKEGT